jgi:MFS family permease
MAAAPGQMSVALRSNSVRSTPGPKAQRATRLVFVVAGLGMATWAPLVPLAKARAGLDEGTLGLLLLCLGVGSIVAMPPSGALTTRFGCRRVLVISVGLMCVALPLLATLSSVPWLVAALLLFGAAMGSVDCAANVQAIIVERASGRSMMSGFHGLFSLGGILGAAGVTALLSAGLPPVAATVSVVALIGAAIVAAAPGLLTHGSESQGPAFAIPHGAVLFIGVLCFVVFLTEGAMLDWAALFLISARDIEPSHAGFGYAVFALTMTVGRLTGDAVVRRAGGKTVVVLGSLLAAAGLVTATLVPAWEAALLGYALVGAGCSNIVPVMYTAVGRQQIMPEGVAVVAITTLGYAGILVGPAFIGLLAEATSMSVAFLTVAVLLVGVAAGGRMLRV